MLNYYSKKDYDNTVIKNNLISFEKIKAKNELYLINMANYEIEREIDQQFAKEKLRIKDEKREIFIKELEQKRNIEKMKKLQKEKEKKQKEEEEIKIQQKKDKERYEEEIKKIKEEQEKEKLKLKLIQNEKKKREEEEKRIKIQEKVNKMLEDSNIKLYQKQKELEIKEQERQKKIEEYKMKKKIENIQKSNEKKELIEKIKQKLENQIQQAKELNEEKQKQIQLKQEEMKKKQNIENEIKIKENLEKEKHIKNTLLKNEILKKEKKKKIMKLINEKEEKSLINHQKKINENILKAEESQEHRILKEEKIKAIARIQEYDRNQLYKNILEKSERLNELKLKKLKIIEKKKIMKEEFLRKKEKYIEQFQLISSTKGFNLETIKFIEKIFPNNEKIHQLIEKIKLKTQRNLNPQNKINSNTTYLDKNNSKRKFPKFFRNIKGDECENSETKSLIVPNRNLKLIGINNKTLIKDSICDEMIVSNLGTQTIKPSRGDYINELNKKNNGVLNFYLNPELLKKKEDYNALIIEKPIEASNCCVSCT
jgi:hypothetical protein